MAHFFTAPDFYGMAQDRNKRFSDQIDHFVEAGPFAQYARYKAAKEAKKREALRDERERLWDDFIMKQSNQSQQEQTPAATQEQQLPAMLDPSKLTPEQINQLQLLGVDYANA